MDLKLKIRLFKPSLAKQIEQELKDSRINGLTTFDCEDKLIVVFLVTNRSICVFNSESAECVEFIAKQLKSNKFKIYTADGVMDAYNLKEYMGIKMGEQMDLPTIHCQLVIRQYARNNLEFRRETLGWSTILRCIDPRSMSYGELVKIYLGKFAKMELSSEAWEMIDTLPPLEREIAINNLASVTPLRELARAILRRINAHRNEPMRDMTLMSRADPILRQEYEAKLDNNYYSLSNYVQRLPIVPQ